MKICIVDLETTGLDPKKHEIIEFGAYIFYTDGYKIPDTYTFKIKPRHIENADPAALQINGYNEEEWKDAISLEEFKTWVKGKLPGFTFCSFPLLFDYGFMEAAGLGDVFDRYKLDLFTMAWMKTGKIEKLKDYCRLLGIQPEPNTHRAINGARCAYELFKKIV